MKWFINQFGLFIVVLGLLLDIVYGKGGRGGGGFRGGFRGSSGARGGIGKGFGGIGSEYFMNFSLILEEL